MGRVIEVLGYPDDFGIDVEIIIRKHHLPHEFPDDVVDQARAIPATVDPAEAAHAAATSGISTSSPSTARPRAISTTRFG